MLFIMWNLLLFMLFQVSFYPVEDWLDWIVSISREPASTLHWCGQQQQQQQQHGRQLRTSQARSPMNINREGIRFLFFFTAGIYSPQCKMNYNPFFYLSFLICFSWNFVRKKLWAWHSRSRLHSIDKLLRKRVVVVVDSLLFFKREIMSPWYICVYTLYSQTAERETFSDARTSVLFLNIYISIQI